MDIEQFDYHLPPELIATHPADRRELSRLLVLDRSTGQMAHRSFAELTDLLRPGDCLVINDSRVIPARLEAWRTRGGKCDLLLLEPRHGTTWEVMVRPARKIRPGDILSLPGDAAVAQVLAETGGRTRLVRFKIPAGGGDAETTLLAYLEHHGHVPLPPYILQQRKERGESSRDTDEDRVRYQTVYAQPPGSVAAPTAGLHFTPELMSRIRGNGVELRRVTLHVGLGTFTPVEFGRVETHRMHAERYSIQPEEAVAIEAARRDFSRRVLAVGTTTVRALESCFARHGCICADAAATDLFIYPGFRFGVIQAMITNFHLPRSSLLLMVAAFAGRDRILAAYREAIRRRYRFYSYGDAMFIA